MFKKNTLKKRKGFTVVEIISAAGLMALIGVIAVSIINISFRSERITSEEYSLQTATRELMDNITDTIRYSTAVFIIPESSFNSNNIDTSLDFIPYASGGYLSSEWNYYGILDNSILHYAWNDSLKGHVRRELFVGANDNLTYELTFNKKAPDDVNDSLVEFYLSATPTGSSNPEIEIQTAADSLNSMQVVDWSSPILGSFGRAIAYRRETLPRSTPIGRVVLVLDVSGSMTRNMDNSAIAPAWTTNPNARINALKRAAISMIKELATIENLEITIIPYSMYANFGNQLGSPNINYSAAFNPSVPQNPELVKLFGGNIISNKPVGEYNFVSVSENVSELEAVINRLYPLGGTNSGDGIRRGYYAFQQAPTPPDGRDIKEYFIFMTDGEANGSSMLTLPGYIGWLSERMNPPFFTVSGDVHTTEDSMNTSRIGSAHINGTSQINRKYSLTYEAANTNAHNDLIYQYYTHSYMRIFADKLMLRTTVPQVSSFNAYVVACSSQSFGPRLDDLSKMFGLGDIAATSPSVYRATNVEDLIEGFKDIADSIILDMWHVSGPNIIPPTGP